VGIALSFCLRAERDLLNTIAMYHVCLQSKLIKLAADAGLTLAYSSESSIEAELTRESTADILTVVVSMGYLSQTG
jgi:hypothetical protein